MKKFKVILIFLLLLNSSIFAIDKISLEVDALPYITGGNYIGVGVANNGFNYRFIKADVNMPNFILPNHIDSVNMDVYTFIVDYFFRGEDYDGPWIGLGYELWNLKVKEENSNIEEDLTQHIFTLGGGYVFSLGEYFFVNPWIAVHYDLNNDTEKLVGNTIYKPKRITPEASLKFGFRF